MAAFIVLVYIAITLALMPFICFLALLTVSALFYRRRPVDASSTVPSTTKFLFVIPAHNEQDSILDCVAACLAVDWDPRQFAVAVIADNCSDRTAAAALAAGALVVERTDSVRRSKGYALEYFFTNSSLADTIRSYDAVIVIDADTVVDRGILQSCARSLADGNDWIQCYNTVLNAGETWRTRLVTLAFSLINGVWLLGQERLGLSVGLKGNGMCFSTRGLARFPWKAYGLVEDWEFSWMLRTAGERIRFLPDVCVRSEMLSRWSGDAATQLQRWEAGRRALWRRFLRPVVHARNLSVFQKLMYALELLCPSLATLTLGLLLASTLHFLGFFRPAVWPISNWLLPVHVLMTVAIVTYVVSPVFVLNVPARYLLDLFGAPYHVAWKLLMVPWRKPASWVRTPRETRGGSNPPTFALRDQGPGAASAFAPIRAGSDGSSPP
jgi:cellulose synthase/poly-beta-1,6-N-acetylglucosamine synthase-like glycosyltransferase